MLPMIIAGSAADLKPTAEMSIWNGSFADTLIGVSSSGL